MSLETALRPSDLALLLRLLVASCLGGAIGFNRFRAGKPAGVGTHALVSLGAGLFVAFPLQLGPADGGAALSRVIQGIAAGVGFLGAGEIFRDPGGGSRVHGLTSAAAIWATAAIGTIAVCGSWLLVGIAALLILLVLVLSPRIERFFPGRADEGR